jgi:hypothetical protein
LLSARSISPHLAPSRPISPHLAPSHRISFHLARQIRTNSYGDRLPPPLNESTLDLSDEIDEALVANGANATDTALLLNLTNGTNTSSPPPPGMPPPSSPPPPPSIDAPCFFGTCREFLYYREPALSSISPSGGPVRGGFTVTALGQRLDGMRLNASIARCVL